MLVEENEQRIQSIPDDELLKMFFEENGLSSFIPKFVEQKVFSLELINELTDGDLEKLGITLLGDRKKFLKLFASNEFEIFKAKVLYKDLNFEEREKLDIPENRILKQNIFCFKSSSREEGTLTLYENRIVYKSANNHFIIPINKIKDVSIESRAAKSVLKITDDLRTYSFYMVNKRSAVLMGASIANANLELLGLAMMNDKPVTDIEYWRVLIEKLRERNPVFDGDRGQPVEDSDSRRIGCIVLIFFIIFFIIVMIISV
ncbi:MAG: SAM domain-containing protein [Treponema sp.]|nr:SAM domain-containing protein [Treponema sp.]